MGKKLLGNQISFVFKNVRIPIVSDHEELISRVMRLLDGEPKGRFLVAINPEKVCRASHDSELLWALENSAANFADGIGVVFAVKYLLRKSIERIPGIDLFQEILEELNSRKGTVFLFGATETINKACAEVVGRKYSKLRVVGRRHGYQISTQQLVDEINDKEPDLVAVALGSPAQERWMAEHAPRLRAKILMGVGGSFDVISGHKTRAPRIFRTLGLEWAYRLAANPSRIRRHGELITFSWWLVGEWVRSKVRGKRRKGFENL